LLSREPLTATPSAWVGSGDEPPHGGVEVRWVRGLRVSWLLLWCVVVRGWKTTRSRTMARVSFTRSKSRVETLGALIYPCIGSTRMGNARLVTEVFVSLTVPGQSPATATAARACLSAATRTGSSSMRSSFKMERGRRVGRCAPAKIQSLKLPALVLLGSAETQHRLSPLKAPCPPGRPTSPAHR